MLICLVVILNLCCYLLCCKKKRKIIQMNEERDFVSAFCWGSTQGISISSTKDFEISISWTLNLWGTYLNGSVVLLSISLFPHLLDFSFFRHPNHFGLPDNQRIIDPKKGPVKKVAAVRKLPKLDSSGSGGSKSPGNSPRNS